MGVRNQNSTSYVHADEPNLLNLHKSMTYNTQGQPIVRTTQIGNPYTSVGNTNTGTDAFGRMRISQGFTLFDSSHRYADNGLWAQSTSGGGTSAHNINQGLIEIDVGTASGDEVIRETTKVFSYQPGKSLMVMNTFCFGTTGKANQRQRAGYFGADNGIYLELDGTDIYFVERSSTSGSTVNTRIAQADWNIDKLDGTTPSGITLDISKAQIMWSDIEWLGLGTVRVGFVINGQFVVCHAFHHANLISGTYITTASLPIRQEITNTDTVASPTTAKQVCSTVISEGGYTLTGLQQAVQTPITTPSDLTVADTYYPVISLRLKTARLDAIVILTALSMLGLTNNANYNWQVIASGATTGGTWVSAGANSSVEYNITGTSFTQGTGRILASGFMQGSNQGSSSIDILKEALFKFQLERDSLASTMFELTLVVAADLAGADVYASLDFEEISR